MENGPTAPTSPLSFSVLPNELVYHILSLLDSPPPSEPCLHDISSPYSPRGQTNILSLKTCSLVNRRWRAAALPLLFRHVQWPISRDALLRLEHDDDPLASIPALDFLRSNNLGHCVQTLGMLLDDKEWPDDQTDGSEERLVMKNSSGTAVWTTYHQDYNWLWDAIFELVNPKRFTIVASPRILARLFARSVYLGDAWSFGPQLHVLSLSREHRHGKAKSGPEPAVMASGMTRGPSASAATPLCQKPSPKTTLKQIPCTLFTVRPWSKLLLNEGPSIRVYTTYEFFLKRPPSILGALLGCETYPNDYPLLPASVTDLSYVAAFPLSTHVATLVRSMPVLDRLFVQLVPREDRYDVLGDAVMMRNVDATDLWTERNSAYQLIMGAILGGQWGGNWDELSVFESGDSADREAWELAPLYMHMSKTQWRVIGDGVFMKGGGGPLPGDDDDDKPHGHDKVISNVDSDD